jgi:hypothetical protein
MFNYATYNGIPILTYGLIGLSASILALVTFNPSILELKEDGKQTTVANAIGLDKIQMPAFLSPGTSSDLSPGTSSDNTSYIPGINGMPLPFSSDEPDNAVEDDEVENEPDYEDEQSSVYNPLRQDENPSGGRKTRNKRKKLRKTKRKK